MLPLVIFFIWLQLCSGFISSDDAAAASSSEPSTSTPPSTMPPFPTLPTSAPVHSSITYKVAAQRVSNQPILSKDMGSFWDFNYNAALFQKDDEIGLFVRVQNLKDENVPLNGPGPSYLAISKLIFKNGQVCATPTINETMTPLGLSEAGGTEDPRITFNNGLYYLFYTAYDGINKAVLSSAITANPFEPNSWIRLSEDLPLRNWSKSGAALFASKENGLTKDYLFWGDSSYSDGIQIAIGEPGKWGWKDYNTYLLKKRNETKFFDSVLVESGPSPLKLNTGDYLFIYNSARAGYYTRPDWNLQYNIGYAILAETDPTQVLDRSKRPLMSPELDWEIGDSDKYLKPNVVFLEGLIPDPDGCKYANVSGLLGDQYVDNAECFFGVYGAADSNLGAVRIIVSTETPPTNPPPPTTTTLPTTTKTASITTTASTTTTSAQTSSSPVPPVTIPTVPIAKTTTTKETPVPTSTVSEASVSITSPTPPPTTTTTTSDANTKVLNRLLFVHAIWRNGDRTPLDTFPNDPSTNDWDGLEMGELTELGMRQQFELGQRFREQYVTRSDKMMFLNSTFRSNEIYIRSSGK
uniref:Arabinanase/levansucrase/invertase n=1 Tax=Panagrolaimus sp. PS1159 TaxID=55785 RepID=A0AC35EVN7_9BILA